MCGEAMTVDMILCVHMSRGSNAALGGEVAGSLGGVGREAPFLPQRQGGGHQAGVREPASIGQTTSSPSRCSARHEAKVARKHENMVSRSKRERAFRRGTSKSRIVTRSWSDKITSGQTAMSCNNWSVASRNAVVLGSALPPPRAKRHKCCNKLL